MQTMRWGSAAGCVKWRLLRAWQDGWGSRGKMPSVGGPQYDQDNAELMRK